MAMTRGRADAILAAVQAEIERRRAELDGDATLERADFVVLRTRGGPGRYRVQFRKACEPVDSVDIQRGAC